MTELSSSALIASSSSFREMDHHLEGVSSTTFLMLNDDCLLKIFEYLQLDDLINVAGSCTRLRLVADRIFKKYSIFMLDSEIVKKGEKYIDNVLSYISQHVSSLTFNCLDAHLTFSKILEIVNTCICLKCLQINDCEGETSSNASPVHNFNRVKQLTLKSCNCDFTKSFLKHFHKLEALNVQMITIDENDWKTILQNNPNIVSFIYRNRRGCGINYDSLELIPNVETLHLWGSCTEDVSQFNSLPTLRLSRLTKLTLFVANINIKHVLRELSKNGIMEELQLLYVETDDEFFVILSSFEKLKLLHIIASQKRSLSLKSSMAWPSKLKDLQLASFKLTHNDLIAMIRQLQHLEIVDLYCCYIVKGFGTYFKDVTKLPQQILGVIDRSKRKQRLDLLLPFSEEDSESESEDDSESESEDDSESKEEDDYISKVEDHSKKYIIDTDRLRIFLRPEEMYCTNRN